MRKPTMQVFRKGVHPIPLILVLATLFVVVVGSFFLLVYATNS